MSLAACRDRDVDKDALPTWKPGRGSGYWWRCRGPKGWTGRGWRGSSHRWNGCCSRGLNGHVEPVSDDPRPEHAAHGENAHGDHECGPSTRPARSPPRRIPDKDGGPDDDGRGQGCRHQLPGTSATGEVGVVEGSARAVTIIDPSRAHQGGHRHKDDSAQDQGGHLVGLFRPVRHCNPVYQARPCPSGGGQREDCTGAHECSRRTTITRLGRKVRILRSLAARTILRRLRLRGCRTRTTLPMPGSSRASSGQPLQSGRRDTSRRAGQAQQQGAPALEVAHGGRFVSGKGCEEHCPSTPHTAPRKKTRARATSPRAAPLSENMSIHSPLPDRQYDAPQALACSTPWRADLPSRVATPSRLNSCSASPIMQVMSS